MPNLQRPSPSGDPQNRRLLNALANGDESSCKVAELPTKGISNGTRRFATDGLKVGESTGFGTGCPVYFDEASGDWLRFSDDTVVTT